MTDEVPDTMGIERERAKLHGEAADDEGQPLAKMATTYGSAFVQDEDDASMVTAEETSDAGGTRDGVGRPQSSPQGSE